MQITTEHNDRKITYTEHSDEWECKELDVKAKTLSALKTKINEVDAAERRLGKNGVILIHVGNYRYHKSVTYPKVRATLLDKGERDGYNAVWITHVDSKSREKVGLHSLILDTPENLATLAEADRIEKEASIMSKKADKMRDSIKRITAEEMKAMALEVKPE